MMNGIARRLLSIYLKSQFVKQQVAEIFRYSAQDQAKEVATFYTDVGIWLNLLYLNENLVKKPRLSFFIFENVSHLKPGVVLVI